MEEKRKGLIVVVVIETFLLILILIGFIQSKNTNQTSDNNSSTNTGTNTNNYEGKVSKNYQEAFSKEGKQVLYIGRTGCGYCEAFTPYMNYLSETYNFTYYYLDTNDISSEELKTLLEKVGQDYEEFGTPYVVFLENGEKYDEIPGYIEEATLFEKLQTNGIIASDQVYISSESTVSNSDTSSTSEDDSSYTNLSFIDYNKYNEIYESNQKSIVVLGQTGCGACKSFKPVINEIAGENNVPINYLDLTQLSSEDANKVLDSLSSYLDTLDSWGTPFTLVIENKKVVSSLSGYNEKDTTVEFFKKQGFIN